MWAFPNTNFLNSSTIAGTDFFREAKPIWEIGILSRILQATTAAPLIFTADSGNTEMPRALVIFARDGSYGEDSPTPASLFDHQKGFFEFWLPLIGLQEVWTLVVERTTWASEEKGKDNVECGKEAARKLAAQF